MFALNLVFRPWGYYYLETVLDQVMAIFIQEDENGSDDMMMVAMTMRVSISKTLVQFFP